MINVLVLCTANSARSVLGEAVLNRAGAGRIRAYSAGSHPRGTPNPLAIELLEKEGFPTGNLRSKSWDEFADATAPKMDVVITVCDAAAGEACPLWPGAPVKAHWGIPDPAGVAGGITAERAAFRKAFGRLQARAEAMLALPLESMSRSELSSALAKIGVMEGATELARDGG
jgi:protein-tyrosine-phosphatase